MLTDTEVSFKKTPQTVEWRTEKIFCFWYEQLVGKQRFEGLKLLLRHSDCECFLHKCFIERLLQAWLIFSSTGIKLLLPPNYCIPFDKIVIIYMMLCHVLDVHPIFFSNLLFKLYTEKQNLCGVVLLQHLPSQLLAVPSKHHQSLFGLAGWVLSLQEVCRVSADMLYSSSRFQVPHFPLAV